MLLVAVLLSSCVGYVKKDGVVYYRDCNEANVCSERKIDADAKTFETLKDGFARDKSRVFKNGDVIEGADAETFTVMKFPFAKDKNHAYYCGKVIKSSTGQNFEIINDDYSKNDIDVFYRTNPLNVCSVKEFRRLFKEEEEPVCNYWSTDGCNYYFQQYKIPSDDYINVQLLKETAGYAKDKNWIYRCDRKLNINPDGEKILDTVDVATFSTIYYSDNCRDKFGCIDVYKGRVPCN